MIELARDMAPRETGGLLVGYWSLSGAEAVIAEATPAGPAAIEQTDSFTPDYEFDRELIAKRFSNSDGRHTYLGDWHSHPESKAYLSPHDIQTLRVIGTSPEAQTERPFMLIVGGEGSRSLAAWVWLGQKGWLFRKKDIVEAVELRVV